MSDYDECWSHTSVIREHYVFLLETLDVKISGIVHELYSKEVVSALERDDIIAEMTSFRANEKLLSVLSRKSPRQFQLFLDALDNCGQKHVRNVIAELRPGLWIIYTVSKNVPDLACYNFDTCELITVARDCDSDSEDCSSLVVLFIIFYFFFSVHQIFDVPGPIFAKLCHTTRYVLK